MEKPKKTAREFAEMIAAEFDTSDVRLNILRDAAGWHAVVYGSSPDRVHQAQSAVNQILDRLRVNYDLDD